MQAFLGSVPQNFFGGTVPLVFTRPLDWTRLSAFGAVPLALTLGPIQPVLGSAPWIIAGPLGRICLPVLGAVPMDWNGWSPKKTHSSSKRRRGSR